MMRLVHGNRAAKGLGCARLREWAIMPSRHHRGHHHGRGREQDVQSLTIDLSFGKR